MLESDLNGLLKWLYRLWPSMVVVAVAIGFGSFLMVRRLRSQPQRIGIVVATVILALPLVILVPLFFWNLQTYPVPGAAVHVWNRSLSVVSLDSKAGDHAEVAPCSTATVYMDVEQVQVKVGAKFAFTFGGGSPGVRYVYAHGRQAWGHKPPDPLPRCA